MQSTLFISPWIGPGRNFTRGRKARCSTTPSMTLLSHEKLEVLSTSKDVEVAKYQLEIEIPGKFSKDRRRQSIQSMRKNANFPGFRKGTLPPYVMNEINDFVLHDCTNDMIEDALQELDLLKADGDEAEPELEIEEMSNRFRSGEDFVFTCKVQTREVLTDGPVENLEEIVTTDVEIEKVVAFKDPEEKEATA